MLAAPRALRAALFAALVAATWVGLRAYEPVRVAGGSMEPALYSGDLVLVERGRGGQANDIVLLRLPGKGAVLHRIVALDKRGVARTKGDANESLDISPVASAAVAGRVVAVVPVGGLLSRWRDD